MDGSDRVPDPHGLRASLGLEQHFLIESEMALLSECRSKYAQTSLTEPTKSERRFIVNGYRNFSARVPKTASSQNFPFVRSRAINGARYAAHVAMKPRSVLNTAVRTVIALPSSGTIW